MRCLNCGEKDLPINTEICPRCGVYLPSLMRDLLPPGQLLNRYRINYPLGRGGFGVTYHATHTKLDRAVAIKEFYPAAQAVRDEKTARLAILSNFEAKFHKGLRRFLKEAQILNDIEHPNIIKIRDFFQENNTAYIVMNLISGKTLSSFLKEQPNNCLSPQRVKKIISVLVDAIETIHASSIYHLDIKPDNILIANDGKLILVDFGASKQGMGNESTQAFTLNYAPLEVISGKEFGAYSDIYSLGVTIYQMLTGKLPPNALDRTYQDNWTLDDLQQPWRNLIEAAVRMNPKDRPARVTSWWKSAFSEEQIGNRYEIIKKINGARYADAERVSAVIETEPIKAQMIPERLPYDASFGEKKLFSVLQNLPEHYIVYYKPVINERYPDFLVICPDMGLLVIEVKDWCLKDIIAGDSNTIIVNDRRLRKQVSEKHPVRLARDYMRWLIDECRKYREGQDLLHKVGEDQNRFIFPFGHFAILSNITSEQLRNHPRGDFTTIFPPEKMITREVLQSWIDDPLSAEQLCQILRSYFDPNWPVSLLTKSQIDTLRAIVFPEILISGELEDITDTDRDRPIVKGTDLKVLDSKGQNNARTIGGGHRIVFGVTGSGKTVLLISRAKTIARERPEAEILLLCYNVILAAYLRGIFKSYRNVRVLHFEAWAKKNGVTRQIMPAESDKELGDRLLAILSEGYGEYGKYDAVMVDEARDFDASWFKCVLKAMKDPDDGDLLIVGDASSFGGFYPRGKVSWREIGIHCIARVYYKKFDLDKNYRNPREVVELAAIFASKANEDDKDAIVSIKVDPDNCVRSAGFKPVAISSGNKQEESTKIIEIVKNLLDGQWFGNKIDEPLQPRDIGIFYPLMYKKDREIMKDLLDRLRSLDKLKKLKKVDRVIWLTDPNNPKNKELAFSYGIKVQTIDSAKGLEYKAVILMWTDNLPRPDYFDNADELEDRRLLYVGLTRPEDFLVISSSGRSKFVDEIENSGKVTIVDGDSEGTVF